MIRKRWMNLKAMLMLVTVFTLTFGLVACSKDDNMPDTPAARLMAINLVPDLEAVNIDISGNRLNNLPLDFTSYTGGYLNIFPGNRTISSYSAPMMELLDTVSYNFEQDNYYSVFVTGIGGSYNNVIVHDNYDAISPETGKAFIRYINAIEIPGQINIGSLSEVVASGQVSNFVTVDAGTLQVSFSSEMNEQTSREITFDENKAYTILVAGNPDSQGSENELQIRYIVNGTITE